MKYPSSPIGKFKTGDQRMQFNIYQTHIKK